MGHKITGSGLAFALCRYAELAIRGAGGGNNLPERLGRRQQRCCTQRQLVITATGSVAGLGGAADLDHYEHH